MDTFPQNSTQQNFYPQALLQFMLYRDNLSEMAKLIHQIEELKQKISSKQKKHRRCDWQIVKDFNCEQCGKVYASQVALKLHLKLKHKEKSEVGHTEQHSASTGNQVEVLLREQQLN